MEKIIESIKNLVNEAEKIEVFYYIEAVEKFFLLHKIKTFNEKTTISGYREDIDEADWNYFTAVQKIFDEQITNKDNNESYGLALKEIKKLKEPDGFLSHYGSWYYTFITTGILDSAMKLYSQLKTEFKDLKKYDKDKQLYRLQMLQEIQYKTLLTLEEVETLTNRKSSSIDSYRSRRRNPMPYIGGGKGSDLMFNKEKVLHWMENYL